MKTILLSILAGFLLLISLAAFKMQSKSATTTFKVWGNCNMCKKTIEKAAKIKGVSKAEWNKSTKILSVTYNTNLVSLDEIQKKIAEAGYDNDKYKADDKAYGKLNKCCQYERKQ